MSYKTTLLKETKSIISEIKNEIKELLRINSEILKFECINEWDLKLVEQNLEKVKQKEKLIELYKENLQEILKMEN